MRKGERKMATKRASKIWITWNEDGSVKVKANRYDEVVKDFYKRTMESESWVVGAKYAETCVAKIKLNCEDWRWDGEIFEEHEGGEIEEGEEDSEEGATASEIIYHGEHVFDIGSRHYYKLGDAWASCDHGGLNESFEDKDEMEYFKKKFTCA